MSENGYKNGHNKLGHRQNSKNNSNKMFKFKSYNVKKVSEKNEKEQAKSSFSTGTLKKSSSSLSSSKETKPSSFPSSSKGTKSSSSSSSSTEKKPSSMTFAKKQEIKHANNKQSPEYSKKIYPKKTVTKWNENTTYSAKNETKKVVIPSPHKKLERK